MESLTKTQRFIPLQLQNLKIFADSKSNLILYNHVKQTIAGNQGPRAPQVSLFKVIPNAHQDSTNVLRLFTDSQTNKNYLISGSFDKKVNLWDLSADQPTTLTSLKHPKKVDFGFVDLERATFTFSDKTGEIYETSFGELTLTPATMVAATMDTLAFMDRYRFADGKEYLILTDEYEKLKFLKYPEIYHMTNVFSPYKNANFIRVLDLTPNALVALFSTGDIDLINLKSLETNDYTAERLDVKGKMNGKHVSEICKIDSNHFLGVDNFFTEIIIYQIQDCTVVKEKTVDITGLKILRDESEQKLKSSIEAEKDGDYVILTIKYERSPKVLEDTELTQIQSEVKIYETVHCVEFVIHLE